MKIRTQNDVAELLNELGATLTPAALEIATYLVRLCDGLEALCQEDAAQGRAPLSKAVFDSLMNDTFLGNSAFAADMRSEWSCTAQTYYMCGFGAGDRQLD